MANSPMILFVFNLIYLFIGVILGWLIGKRADVSRTIGQIQKEVVNKIHGEVKPGIIKRPDINKYNALHEPKAVREERDAIKRVLDTVPELVRAREAAKNK